MYTDRWEDQRGCRTGMAGRSRRSHRAARVLTGSLMLAPAVAALRTPLLVDEAGAFNPWRVETVRAVTEKSAAAVEGLVAAQMSMAYSASQFWLEIAKGQTPSLLTGVAVERALHAALKPSGSRVRQNYSRLRPRS